MVRYPEVYVYGVLQLLLNLLSVRVADVAIVQGGGLAMCERSDEYIEPRKFEMSLFVWFVFILVDRHLNLQAKLMFYFLEKVFLKGLPSSHYKILWVPRRGNYIYNLQLLFIYIFELSLSMLTLIPRHCESEGHFWVYS